MYRLQSVISAPSHHYRPLLLYRAGAFLLMALLALASFQSEAASRIELVDGTLIIGDLVSVSNGRYVIDSASLGQIEIPESAIRSIEPLGNSSPAGASDRELGSIQQQIVNTPELMQLVTAMMSDPQIQAMLQDPELLKLIMSGDLARLNNDPRIQQLMANPAIQAIIGKMQQNKP